MIFKSEIIYTRIIFPFIAGIIGAYYLQFQSVFDAVSISLAIFIVFTVFFNVFYKYFKLWRYKAVVSTVYYFVFFLLGAFASLWSTDFLKKDYFGHRNYEQLKIWVANEPQQTNDILRFEANVTTGFADQKTFSSSGKLLIALKLDSLSPIKLNYGDELMVTADYSSVEPAYNPGEFDFKGWLATKNIYQQTFINQNQVVNLNQQRGNPIVKYALAIRQEQIATFRKLIKDDEAFAVASTLILGYRADLSKETLAAYSRTGTIHALSVSGMHVGIIYIMLAWLLSFLDKRKSTRVVKVVLICALIWYYSLLTGFSSSILRAAIMLTTFILAKQLKRSKNNYNVLAFTAFCLLVYNPFFIWNAGFQLSFLAVFGLIYFQPKIYKWWYVENKWADQLWSTVALCIAAQLATLPLSIYYFHQFPVYFILSNLFILIPITLLMYAGLAILILTVHFLAPAFEWLIIFINNGLKWIANLPFAGITEIWIDRWQLLLLCLLLTTLTIGFTHYKKAYLFLGLTTFAILQLTIGLKKINSIQQEELILFSLRKNYALAFIKGNKSILITDLERNDKNFEFFVRPALDQKQVKEIKFINWDEDFTAENFIKEGKQILYRNKTILMMDETFNNKKLIGKPNFEFVWMHNTPKQKIELLKQEINFNTLILDATNKDYALANFAQKASELNLVAYTLKKQAGITLKLN